MSFNENVSLITELFGKRPRFRGVTGRLDDDGLVNPNPTIGLDVCYTWVRKNGERTAIAVLNARVTTQRANIPVIVEENDDGNLEIIGLDTENARFTYGAFAPALNMPDRLPEQDKSSIPHRRIKDLRLRLDAAGGLVLYLEPGFYQVLNGDIKAFLGDDIDLTASLPGSADTKRLVLIGITTATNTITSSAVTAVSTGTAPTETPFFTTTDAATARNAASASVLWCWAVPMFNGQTSFGNTDSFIDLRPIQWEEGGVYQVTASSPLASSGGNSPNISLTGTVPVANGGTGQTTATAAFNALSPLTTKADLLTNDGTNDIRLAIGTNGYSLRPNSALSAGLEWSIIGATFETSISTSDATLTDLISYVVAELVGVTIAGRIIATKTDRTAAYGASFRVTFRRATAGNVTLVGAGWSESDEDSGGTPAISFAVNTGAQTGLIQWTGIIAENWSIKAHYTITTA